MTDIELPDMKKELPADYREAARRYVAGRAEDVDDARFLLDVLGLLPSQS